MTNKQPLGTKGSGRQKVTSQLAENYLSSNQTGGAKRENSRAAQKSEPSNAPVLAEFLLERGFARLFFGGDLERQYRRHISETSVRRHRWLVLIGLILTAGFGFVDPLLAPDVLSVSWSMRFGVLTPLLIIKFVLSYTKIYDRIESLATSFVICVAAGTIISVMQLSSAELKLHYHGMLILVVLYGHVVTRARFWQSFVWSSLVLLGYYITFGMATIADPIMGYYGTLVAIVTSVGLLANYQLEYQSRSDYLKSVVLSGENTRLEQVHEELYQVSVVDSLTGLYNRRHFDDSLAHVWRDAFDERKPVSLLFIDVDCFKRFNDTYGHQRGDDCLKAVAGALRSINCRPSDIVARYGGEEFVIILPGMGEVTAVKFADAIRKRVAALKMPHRASTVGNYVTVSIGVATEVPGRHTISQDLVARADKALYEAKERGRNQVYCKNIRLELVPSA